jgi:hypothetical protein
LGIFEVSELAVDLAERWRRARTAALRLSLPEAEATMPEEALLVAALDRSPDDVLRRVFDHSFRLGEGFRRFYRLDLPLADLVEFLPTLATPCLARTATRAPDEPAFLLVRKSCPAAAQHSRACDYWREAISGLVHGMTGAVRHARHDSAGHGGSSCVDVVYVEPRSKRRFGPIPAEVSEGLESLRRPARSFDSSIEIEFLGVSEGVLHYTSKRSGGGGPVGVSTVIEQGVRRRFPWLTAREVTPKPVLSETPS